MTASVDPLPAPPDPWASPSGAPDPAPAAVGPPAPARPLASYGAPDPPSAWAPPSGWDTRRPTAVPGRGWTAAAVALALALVGLVGVQEVREERQLDALRAQVAGELPALRAAVERGRGLRFLRPVEVDVLDDDAFVEELFTGEEPAGSDARDPAQTWTALGLVDDPFEVYEGYDDALSAGVAGFYEPGTDRLVVRGRALTVSVRVTLVHELAHALDDQHFGLDRSRLEGEDDPSRAWQALVEGSASRVESAYVDALPSSEQEALLDEEGPSWTGGAPEVVTELLNFSYVSGEDYVDDLVRRGGVAALDRAFRSPPPSTEEVLDPSEGTVRVPQHHDLPPDGERLDAGSLGVLGLALVLGEDPAEAVTAPALTGWDGDSYVTYRTTDDRVCTRGLVQTDSAADALALATALGHQPRVDRVDSPSAAGVGYLSCA